MSDENTQNQPMDETQVPLGQGGNVPEFPRLNLDPQVQAGILEQINLTVRAQIAAQFAAGRTAPAAAAGAPSSASSAPVPEAAPLRIPTFNWNNEASNLEQQPTVSRNYSQRVFLPGTGDTVVEPSNEIREKSPFENTVRHSLHGNGNNSWSGKKSKVCHNELQYDTVLSRKRETHSLRVILPCTNNRVQGNINSISPPREGTEKEKANIHYVATNNPGKRARAESPNQISQSELNVTHAQPNLTVPARKKRRLFDPNQKDDYAHLKQGKIDMYFAKTNNQISDTQDRINLANLLALDAGPPSTDQISGGDNLNRETHVHGDPQSQEAIPDFLEREPILFNDYKGKYNNIWTLDADNRPNSSRLTELITELRKHDQDVLSRSIIRVKSQMSDTNFKKKVNKKNKKKKLKSCDANNVDSLPPQDETLQMPSRTKTTWNQARAAAVEAAKSTNRATFYRQAPSQNLYEYWCFGLERTPGYLMKLEEFRSELHQMRLRHAREQMQLAAQHLEKETQINLDSAADMRSNAITSIQQSIPDRAERVIREASVSYDITVANMGANEFRELDKRRQTLQASPPTTGDIIDPVSNIARSTTRSDENKGFRGRGRGGRGASRSWRNSRGRKPYGRSNQPQNK